MASACYIPLCSDNSFFCSLYACLVPCSTTPHAESDLSWEGHLASIVAGMQFLIINVVVADFMLSMYCVRRGCSGIVCCTLPVIVEYILDEYAGSE